MQNKSHRLLSMFNWKTLFNLKSLAILSLLFSAAAHAETCPDSRSFKLDEKGHYYSLVSADGVSWRSGDNFSAKVGYLTLNYVEIRRDEENRKMGDPTCHYSNDPRQFPRIFVVMYPSQNEIASPQASSKFVTAEIKINSETVSQCQVDRHDGSNCAFDVTKTGKALKASAASPFGTSQAEECDFYKQEMDKAQEKCRKGDMTQCQIAEQFRQLYVQCIAANPGP